jgi:hypothetical protein
MSDPRVPIERVAPRRDSAHPSGMRIAHIQFLDACPLDLFELAINGAG